MRQRACVIRSDDGDVGRDGGGDRDQPPTARWTQRVNQAAASRNWASSTASTAPLGRHAPSTRMQPAARRVTGCLPRTAAAPRRSTPSASTASRPVRTPSTRKLAALNTRARAAPCADCRRRRGPLRACCAVARLLGRAGRGASRCPVADGAGRHGVLLPASERAFRAVSSVLTESECCGGVKRSRGTDDPSTRRHHHGELGADRGPSGERMPVSQLLLLTNTLQPSTEVLPGPGPAVARAAGGSRRGLRPARGTAGRRPARRRPPRPAARALPVPGAAHHRRRLPASCSWRPRAAWPLSPPTGESTTCILDTAGPAEVEARLRLAIGRLAEPRWR